MRRVRRGQVRRVAGHRVGVGRRKEICGNNFSALVDELIESMLAVSAGLAPDDGAGGAGSCLSILLHMLAV